MSNLSLSTNRFASLDSSDDDDEPPALDDAPKSVDFFTPSGKKIIRDRSVIPSENAKEMQWQTETVGRGNRGRGRRGGRG